MKNSWKSTSNFEILYKRSLILSKIRHFFFKNNILEVETPMISQYTTTDLYLSPFKISTENSEDLFSDMWLITSPEYHMKRLLASGITCPIYQICRSFRWGEIGKNHNPEFSILECYQPFYNMFDMINFIDIFLQEILHTEKSDKISYQDIFIMFVKVDPLNTNFSELQGILKNINQEHLINSKDTIKDLLDLIFMLEIFPKIGKDRPIFVYHYPADQAMLARINSKDHQISDRFEFFFQGLELGNGFFELTDQVEQKKRFDKENHDRIALGLKKRILDINFLEALSKNNIPDCSGVAIGLDRIIMILLKVKKISKVLSFSYENC